MNENIRTIEYVIPESFDGQTIGAFLRSKRYSRRVINHLKTVSEGNVFGPESRAEATDDTRPAATADNAALPERAAACGILLDGRPARTIDRLTAGQCLTIRLPETEESPHVIESPIALDILYEDADIWVVNKPANMPVHPSMGHFENTLGNALCYYTHHVLGRSRYVERIINRLDRDTSGALIAAKNSLAAAVLGEAVTKREIHRIYLAVCSGDLRQLDRPLPYVTAEAENVFGTALGDCIHALGLPWAVKENPAPGEALQISAPLGRKPGSVVERCVDPTEGESAVTHCRLLHYDPVRDLSVLLLKLETGRTHQIRVHMQYIGHPLPGDFLYNPDMRYIQRQALHSAMLSFLHPITGEKMSCFAPLPEDMVGMLN